MNILIVRWECPRRCGYFREWHATPTYLTQFIDHPLYGLISGEELVERDISTHSCGFFRNAHSKAEQARLAREEMPAVYGADSNPIHPAHVSRAGVGSIRSGRRTRARDDSPLSEVLPDSKKRRR